MRSPGWRPSVVAIMAATAVAAGACGSATHPHGDAHAAAPECPPAGARTVQDALLRVPAGAKPGRTPLLVAVMPGGRGDPHDRLGLARAAGRDGFAVLYPLTDDGFWQLNASQGTSDLEGAEALLDRTLARWGFRQFHISATGFPTRGA